MPAPARWCAGAAPSMDVLVASQMGCSLLLLIVTGGMGRTLINLRHVDPGFDPGGAVAITVNASARALAPPGAARLLRGALRPHRGDAAGRAGHAQPDWPDHPGHDHRHGRCARAGPPATDEDRWVRLFFVGPNFFETAGMRIVAGERLGPREMPATAGRRGHAAVRGRSTSAARRMHSADSSTGDVRIIGVVADARYNTFRDAPARAMFLPFTQAPPRSTMTFIVRPGRRRAADDRGGHGRHPRPRPAAEGHRRRRCRAWSRRRWGGSGSRPRSPPALTLLALILSCAGVYATVAFAVSERRRELAVRFALGATARDVAAAGRARSDAGRARWASWRRCRARTR